VRRSLLGRIWPGATAVVLFAAFAFPVYWMFATALKANKDIVSDTPVWFPTSPTFEHFTKAVDAAHRAQLRAQNDLRTAQNATAAAEALRAQLAQQATALQAQLAPLIAARSRLSAAQQAALRDTGVQGVFVAPPGIRGQAMTIALAQRGKPYVWAAAGPSSFDCSGLVVYAYAQAGMPGLPHSSSELSTMGVPVAQADLQAGDLVFFGHPVHHVGIYVGNGLMVNAPDFGQVVKVEALFSGYEGARRLGP